MVNRLLFAKADSLLNQYPIVAVTGPRQSGKTTFCRQLRPHYQYVNLEAPDIRNFARTDPRSFLLTYQGGVILDEVQNVPELFSYLQVFTDERGRTGEYMLTGSQNFQLLERITQSLAGRVAMLNLLPFSISELEPTPYRVETWESALFQGFYPRIYDKNLQPVDFYANYLQTYVERDVRQLINVTDLATFQTFVSVCAGRIGQLLNLSQLGTELGIDHKTVNRWITVLETSFLVYRLPPYYRNFQKRLVKTPKLYFYDVGLASYLLGIRRVADVVPHFAKGSLFENLIINELIKSRLNTGDKPQFYFWRDQRGNEVDVVWEQDGRLEMAEIKAGRTIQADFFKGVTYLNALEIPEKIGQSYLIYGGEEAQQRQQGTVLPWRQSPSATISD